MRTTVAVYELCKGKKIEEKGGFNFEREGHREDESIWARLKEVFESTYEVLLNWLKNAD